jgi:bifunctional enzyme CysN/CysC
MTETAIAKDHMDVVIVGHVDHGKSTVIGRRMADTGSLPEGKLEQVKAMWKANARPFEYAFLLDALKNEQAQGITIDTARCFFKTEKRNYIIHDAPGHIEFLKNMVTGAARAEAALLVIDAEEGVQENSKRHGYMISMLGVKQIAVLVNKMDLVDYSEKVFENIKAEYTEFLDQLGVHPTSFIPVSARDGQNITSFSDKMSWHEGTTVLTQVDDFKKLSGESDKPFRMPIQDIYKFTDSNDDRRILAGTILTGQVNAGDDVVFYPSGKTSTIKSVEGFNTPDRTTVAAGAATGLTMNTQIYVKAGELMCRQDEMQPQVGSQIRVNLFWMGKAPMVKGKDYRLKVGATAIAAQLTDIIQVLDASELSSVETKQQVDRHDVAECILETSRPIAYDLRNDLEATGRVVIVDDYEIAGAGVILDNASDSESALAGQIREREVSWEGGLVERSERAARNKNEGRLVIFHGEYGCGKRRTAKQLERVLFDRGYQTYYFGISNYFEELDHDVRMRDSAREQHLAKLGDLARVVTDAGTLLITTVTDADDYDFEKLNVVSAPDKIFVVNLGDNVFSQFPIDVQLNWRPDVDAAIESIIAALQEKGILLQED